jgi:putative thioredoxin
MNQPREFSLHGAIDLGARQAAAQRRQRAAERSSAAGGDGGAQAGAVIDVTDDTFSDDVLTRSLTVPVIVDLWADWCNPCKQLSPILEKLAVAANGAWVLAKVDAEASPQVSAALSNALQSSSIPLVVAFVGGQIANAFVGALPEPQVRQWLGQIMQLAAQLGLSGQPGGAGPDDGEAESTAAQTAPGQSAAAAGAAGYAPPGAYGDPVVESAFTAAQAAMERGDLNAAAAEFEKVLASYPNDPVATMGLRQVGLIRRVESYDPATARKEADERPDDVQAQARMADIDLASGEIEASFDRMLDTIRATTGEERDAARKHLVSLFEIFPPRDPRVTKARAKLSSLLF